MFRIIHLVYNVILAYIEACLNLFKAKEKKSVRGQNILITGAGHGLGRELAVKFARLGANLVLVDINEENNMTSKQIVAKSFLTKDQQVLAYEVDIRDESQIADLAKTVKKDLGDIDILVNNAGIVQCKPLQELSPTLVERTFQVNVMSHIWTAKHFLPGMIANNRGHVVAIASIAGLIGSKYLSDYCASKYAVVGFMDSLSKEIHDKGFNENIHFTTVCPASMSTGMFQTFTSRFSWLLPVLKADEVAARVVDAILVDEATIVIPYIALFFYRLSAIIPTKVGTIIQDYLDYGVKPHSK